MTFLHWASWSVFVSVFYWPKSLFIWKIKVKFCKMIGAITSSRIYKNYRVMVFNATFNNISVASWRSIWLMEETGVTGVNHRPAASHWQSLSHKVVSGTPRMSGIRTNNVSTDWILIIQLQMYHNIPRSLWNSIAQPGKRIPLKTIGMILVSALLQ